MTLAYLAARPARLQLVAQAEEAQRVRDRRPAPPQPRRQLRLAEAELVHQPPEGLRLLQGVEVGGLEDAVRADSLRQLFQLRRVYRQARLEGVGAYQPDLH